MLPPAKPQISPERLMRFTFGFAPPLMIEAALRYGIFDILDNGARTLDSLCTRNRNFAARTSNGAERSGRP